MWADGRTGTFVGQGRTTAPRSRARRASGPAGKYEGYRPLVVEIVAVLQDGPPPVAAEETLEILAFMEAADESKRLGGAPVRSRASWPRARKHARPMTRKTPAG